LTLISLAVTVILCEIDKTDERSTTVSVDYPVVDTDVKDFYSCNALISSPSQGEPFYGQDAQYKGYQASYTDNGNGTITDNIIGDCLISRSCI